MHIGLFNTYYEVSPRYFVSSFEYKKGQIHSKFIRTSYMKSADDNLSVVEECLVKEVE